MLTNEIQKTLKNHFSNMKSNVELRIQQGEHSKRNSLMGLLLEISNLSELIDIKEGDFGYRSPISFFCRRW